MAYVFVQKSFVSELVMLYRHQQIVALLFVEERCPVHYCHKISKCKLSHVFVTMNESFSIKSVLFKSQTDS